jgi:hypothetical protein
MRRLLETGPHEETHDDGELYPDPYFDPEFDEIADALA